MKDMNELYTKDMNEQYIKEWKINKGEKEYMQMTGVTPVWYWLGKQCTRAR